MMKIFPLCLLLFAALPLQAQTAASDVPPPPAPEPVYICQTDDGRTVRTAVPQGRCRPFSREETVRLGVEETEASEPAAAAKPAGQTDTPRAYICQTPDGKAVFVSQPQGRCQPSHMDGAQIDTSPVATADQELAKIWQAAEAEAGDVQVLPSMQVILRQQQQQTAAKPALSTSIRRPPPRYVPPPKPPSRRELVERDIRREERALAREESELAAARLSRNAERIRRLSQTVNERRSGLRALREELRRYP